MLFRKQSSALIFFALLSWFAPIGARAEQTQSAVQQSYLSGEDLEAGKSGAKMILTSLAQAKTLNEIADCLTNRTAGMLGMALSSSLAAIVNSQRIHGAQPGLQAELNTYLKSYGLESAPTASDLNNPILPDKIGNAGRAFLSGLQPFYDKLGKDSPASAMSIQNNSINDIEQLNYEVMSPSHVKITPKVQAGSQPGLIVAQIEDLKWRLDFGDVNAIIKQVQAEVQPADAVDPLTGARKALDNLSKAKSMTEMADGLTNESAGLMGIIMSIPIGMMLGFMDAFSDPKDKKPSADPNLVKDFGDYFKQYGLDNSANFDPKKQVLPTQLKEHGREFLSGMDAFWSRLDKMTPGTTEKETKQDKFPLGPDDVTYEVISPTRVKISPKKPTKDMPGHFEAMIEDGKWRISLGDIQKLMRQAAITSTPDMNSDTNSTHLTNPKTTKIFDAIKAQDLTAVKRILHTHPKLLNSRNSMGETPLINAAFEGNKSVVAFILTLHPNLTIKDDFGDTAYHKAVFFHQNDIAELLRKHGAK